MDFLRVLAPGVLLTLPPALLFLRWYYGKEVYSKKIDVDMEELKARYPIRDHALLARCGIILGFVLLLFFLHPVVHFEPAYAALFGAIAILLMGSAADFEHALEKVEWDSLLFFAGLFVFTEGIAELGLLRIIADQLSSAIEVVDVDKRAIVSSVLIQVVAAVASAFVDNIPFTTTMIPVISRMAKNVEGLTIQPLAWALCFGADYGGMGTLIGASANVVMAGVAAEAGYPVSFMSFSQNRVADDVPVHLRLRAVPLPLHHDTRGVRLTENAIIAARRVRANGVFVLLLYYLRHLNGLSSHGHASEVARLAKSCTSSIFLSTSGDSVTFSASNASMFSSSCAMDVAPMMVDETYHRVRHQASAIAASETPASFAMCSYCSVAATEGAFRYLCMNEGYFTSLRPLGFCPRRYLPLSAPPASGVQGSSPMS